jgi:hypothetical protein
MRPDELAARSRRQAAENDDRVLRVLVNAGDDGLRPGRELADLAELPLSTTREALCRLIGRGLARRDGKRRAWATTAGRTEVGAGTPGVSLLPALDAAIECFPAEALRAFARLQLAAVPARWHLVGEYSARWPGFISIGHTKSCKTAVASFVCAVYGLDERSAIRLLRRETPGSILGRRMRDRTSPSAYRFNHLPGDLPYLCLDELDKASPGVKAAAGALLHGTTQAELEGEVRTIRPVIYTAMNRREGLRDLDDAYIRRSVMLDTGPLRHLLVDVDLDMARLFDRSGRIPQLALDRLKPPVTELPPDLWRLLRDELRHGLTEEGWALTDTDPAERLALGLAAFIGDLEQAVVVVALDALCCASTLGHTVAGYVDRLAPRLGGGALSPDADAVEQQQQQLAALRRDRERERANDLHRFIERRACFVQMLDEVIACLDLRRLRDCSTDQRLIAHGLAEVVRYIRANAAAIRVNAAAPGRWQALSDAEDQARDPVLRAGELLRHIEEDRKARREIQAAAASTQRTRKPELQPARKAMQLLIDMMSNANGAQLDTLKQEVQQLVVAPPVTEEARRRDHQQLAQKQIWSARRLPGWTP